jgi:hypothetical protein
MKWSLPAAFIGTVARIAPSPEALDELRAALHHRQRRSDLFCAALHHRQRRSDLLRRIFFSTADGAAAPGCMARKSQSMVSIHGGGEAPC